MRIALNGGSCEKIFAWDEIEVLIRNYLETERFLGDGWNDGERGVVGGLVLWI